MSYDFQSPDFARSSLATARESSSKNSKISDIDSG
jgi:hypothetical protein